MMKRLYIIPMVATGLLLPVLPAWSAQPETLPTVVEVKTRRGLSSEPVGRSMGFVFESDGFILTGYRNLTDPAKGWILPVVEVTVPKTGRSYPADVVGVEPTINLGILKIFPDEPLPPAKMAARTGLEVGQEIYAPTALKDDGPSLQLGRLVGLNSRECYQESLTSTMLKAELPLDERSIGAPVVNAAGEVVAIYTGYKPQAREGHVEQDNEAHILPSFLAMNIYESLKHKQSMKSPWTGFSVVRLNERQKQRFPTRHGDRGGIAVEHVWKDSPAEELGVKPGDVLVRFGHYRITSVAGFQKWLYMYGVGHKVKLVFVDEFGEYRVVDYTIEQRPESAVPR